MAAAPPDYGAFTEKFILQPTTSPPSPPPLLSLTFAVKDIFDVQGLVTGFGNPDWATTHQPAISTAPAVAAMLAAGATCIGKTVMDEMAYSINGENAHYGTPVNPCAPDRVPGGSSSGSAVAVAAKIADFSLGTDTGGSVRVPASYCGIFGFRPSHGIVCTDGVVPMAQSFDTVGWFARDPVTLSRVGCVLLKESSLKTIAPTQVIIAEDCFQQLSVPSDQITQALNSLVEKVFSGHAIKKLNLGDYVKENVPSLKHFMTDNQLHNIPSLAALSTAMRLLQRSEFKSNHGKWVTSVKPNLGPGLSDRVWEAINSADDDILDACRCVKIELRAALTSLLGDFGILALPTVPGHPPKLQADPSALETFRAQAFSLLSIAGVSGLCQVSIPLGMHDNLPVSFSLLANHGSDAFLLSVVETIYHTLQEFTDKITS